MNLIFIAEAFRATDTVNPEGAGQLGDFVGGYVGTFFALASVVLLTSTLRNQRRSAQVLNFEAKYFELLRLHRDNVAELEVQGVAGRKLFVVLVREFRSALEIVKQISGKNSLPLSQKQLMHITYNCLFFGTGPNSSRMLNQSLSDFPSGFASDLITKLDSLTVKQSIQNEKKLAYVPFEGHQSRLGHYYRHLYQAVRYVDQQTIDIDKYQYVKTIRAQLSNHEQALLLLNSLTPIGSNWWRQGFIEKYRMVQNIPKDFFDPKTELDVSSLFQSGYFEWEENESAT
ncbi:putative phage abortive infection protein [Candidatus Ferrigenium straubiae]|uniref:putative phage abortive infection protein n=1 Tax=Candidatus Ferrigenium straubiae TaxID=2919506 RepID=UPI003F4AAF7D